ncbi:hypothetical protein HZB74_00950 [Candidatus Saccharibacteria bacterium]|nr:hypothetical protein [Candidatus Saccharibacteria bacterium]
MAKAHRKTIDTILIFLGSVTALALLVAGGIMWWGSNFVNDQVTTELKSQKIKFPPAGSPALTPDKYPDLQQYAGQTVDTGEKARAYANGYINRHLEEVAGGKTYAEVSTAALQEKENTALQAQKQSLFMGETLRGLLLNAYAFGTLASLLKYGAIASFIAAITMGVLVLLGFRRLSK